MRSPPVSAFLLLLTPISGACATTPAPEPAPSAVRAPDDDVEVLKDRIARVERRLADVDAKIGLLLAQKTSRPRPPVAISSEDPVRDQLNRDLGGRDLGPRDLIIEEAPRDEASLGARAGDRSVDLGPRPTRALPEPEPLPMSDGADAGDSDEAVVIRMSGDGPPTVGPGLPEMTTPDALYGWAQDRLKEGRQLEAISAFEEIEKRNPGHDLADNAAYWIGFAHQQRADHRLALQVWERLPLKYPKSSKVPDALFGMAVSHEALGEPAVAETLYEQIATRYPKAEKVREAKKALARLRPR